MATSASLIGFDSWKSLQSGQFRADLHKLLLQGVTPPMQISRHWRLNSQRYRLQGFRYENGEVSLQARPAPRNQKASHTEDRSLATNEHRLASVTR